MLATEITTARQLYDVSPDFREFLKAWDADRRCPYPLADFLLEHGLEEQAKCAMWAATERDRPTYNPITESGELESPSGPYPTMEIDSNDWFFVGMCRTVLGRNCCCPMMFPFNTVGVACATGSTPIDAIIDLMDRWHTRKQS